MSQTYTDDCFAAGHVGQTDLQNMENNFAALKSNFSGTAAPSNAVEGMQWCDTDDDELNFYNGSAWVNIFNYNTMRFNFGAGTIVAADISSSARKPTLVTGQTISPATVSATTQVTAPIGNFTTLQKGGVSITASPAEINNQCTGAVAGHKIINTFTVSGAASITISGLTRGKLYKIIYKLDVSNNTYTLGAYLNGTATYQVIHAIPGGYIYAGEFVFYQSSAVNYYDINPGGGGGYATAVSSIVIKTTTGGPTLTGTAYLVQVGD